MAHVGQEVALELRRLFRQVAGLGQRQFGGLARGDVAADADQAELPPVVVVEGTAQGIEEHPPAIRIDHPAFAGIGLALVERLAVALLPAGAGRAAEHLLVAAPDDVLRRAPQAVGEGLVDPQVTALGVLEPDRVGDRVDQRQQSAALAPLLCFGARALGHLDRQPAVPHQHEGQQGQHAHNPGPGDLQQVHPVEDVQRRQPARLDRLLLIAGDVVQCAVQQRHQRLQLLARGEAHLAIAQPAIAAHFHVGQAELLDQEGRGDEVAHIGIGTPDGDGLERAGRILRQHEVDPRHRLGQQLMDGIALLHRDPAAGQVVQRADGAVAPGEDQAAGGDVGLGKAQEALALVGGRHGRQQVHLACLHRGQHLFPGVVQHRLDLHAQALGDQLQVVGADAMELVELVDHLERRPAGAEQADTDRLMGRDEGTLLIGQRQACCSGLGAQRNEQQKAAQAESAQGHGGLSGNTLQA